MTTEVQLIERYGILLSLDDLAEVLKRSRDGLRIALHGNSEFARTWYPAKKKIGRRVYFRASDVARLNDEYTQC
ncbi:DNA-binding protein [Allopusillimonas ginsengisoli]|nr:DNA-binding protein [Allopusillimonas ginsengisoli]